MNSSVPTPCPSGTYNAAEQMGDIAECSNCPVDHFNNLEGQIGCFYCGGEAEQPASGSTTCLCTGAGRDFQVGTILIFYFKY